VRLLTRKANDFSSRFPQIIAALTALPTLKHRFAARRG
jgi:ATP-dependent DNA ligase